MPPNFFCRLGLATSIIGGDFKTLWVYQAGPFAGALLGASVFTLLHLDRSIAVDAESGEELPLAETYTFLEDSNSAYI